MDGRGVDDLRVRVRFKRYVELPSEPGRWDQNSSFGTPTKRCAIKRQGNIPTSVILSAMCDRCLEVICRFGGSPVLVETGMAF